MDGREIRVDLANARGGGDGSGRGTPRGRGNVPIQYSTCGMVLHCMGTKLQLYTV